MSPHQTCSTMSCNSFGTLLPTRPEHISLTRPGPDPLSPTRIIFPKPIKPSSSSSSSSSSTSLRVFARSASSSSASYYDLLGIPETGTIMEIKQAYKQLARKYHPDVSPPGRVQEYTQRFIRVQEAYETLSDPKRRELYDEGINGAFHVSFSARRRCHKPDHQQTVDKSEWKGLWQSQLSGLKNGTRYRDSGDNMSWGERMRQKREE